ncbi:MAG: energy transducer TonB [Rhodospirillales bacterium]|nr:energy transducer TonB [Rhodospirillales bacterium]
MSQPLHAVPDTAHQDQSAGTVAPLTSVRPASGNPSPKYPGMSRRRGEEGQVVLRVVVGPDGRAVSLSVAQSSGFRRLDQAALDAVRHWRFDPARRGPMPVKGVVRIPIRFVLK